MKKIISILVVVALMLSAVLAIIPISAAKTSDTALATYNVNWKSLFDSGKLRSQWHNNAADKENNYTSLYTVTVDDTSLNSTPIENGDHRSYYSTDMFAISESTYYEYYFEADNNRSGGWSGVVFAYDTVGTIPYFVHGQFDNDGANDELGKSVLRFRKGHHDNRTPVNDVYLETVVKLNETFGCFKIVYEGYTATLYYLSPENNYVSVGSVTLPEGSKVCVGVYSQAGPVATQNTLKIRNCALTAYNEESAMNIPKTFLSLSIAEATLAINDKAETDFIEGTYTALTTALATANAQLSSAEATFETLNDALNALNKAILDLTPAGEANLNYLEIALYEIKDLEETDYTPDSWAAMATAIDTAESLMNNTELTNEDQDTVDGAISAINEAKGSLVDRADFSALEAAIKNAEQLEPYGYEADGWNKFSEALTKAKAVFDDKNSNQDTVNAEVTALDGAIKALVSKTNVMIGSNTEMQYNGEGNIFYFDYHKYIADKKYTAGQKFPTSLDDADDQGNPDYMLRLGSINGEGTSSAADGEKTESRFSHARGKYTINGVEYGHVFGYSFYKAPTVDSVAFYLPTDTKIASIDVYGAVVTEKDGVKLYGKDTEKTYLGTLTVPDGVDGQPNIIVSAALEEALRVEYIFFAIKFDENTSGHYKFYEIELFGLNDPDAEDFSALKDAYAEYNSLVESDYTEDTWSALKTVIATTDLINKNAKSTKTDIETAAKALSDAIDALVTKPADKTALADALKAAEGLEEENYTPDSWKVFADALATAKALNENNAPPQSRVTVAAEALAAAQKALLQKADKTALKAVIDKAEALVEEEWQGNLISWRLFEKGLAEAKEIYANENALQLEINDTAKDLETKIANLMKTPNLPDTDTPPANDETEAPTDDDETEAPATEAPATEAPTEEPPTAAPPTTEGPDSDEPTTEAPATEAPATEDATDTPATDAPTEDEDGCGSSIALSALAVVGIVGTAIAIKKKSKE